MENSESRIVIDPTIMLGKPTIKGTRITVELILNLLSEGAAISDIIDMYPHISKEDIKAALQYASSLVTHEETLSVT
jgi:uncharacterized protein (DUF433 family)